ncbi:MAG TPA: EF-P lysine aminoacylase GenX [Myxococcota bacterium]|nr:EF-P lysine aminoacylase GenX [Myxococcota bacterium]
MSASRAGGAHATSRRLRARATALRALRRWLEDRGYLEIQTPVIVPSPALEANLYALPAGGGWLRTSPELALKKALATGLPRVYEIGPCFRDRERGPWHRAEFTMLEWYRAGAALDDLIDETEALVRHVADALGAPDPGPIPRRAVRDVFRDATGLDGWTATAAELSERDAPDREAAFFRRWVEDVEPRLGTTFLVDWPPDQAALAEVHARRDGAVARRFELYLGGIEIANAFQELRVPAEMLRRYEESAAIRRARGEAPHAVDHDAIEAVGRLPLMSGIAVGFDRLVACLAGWRGLDDGA